MELSISEKNKKTMIIIDDNANGPDQTGTQFT